MNARVSRKAYIDGYGIMSSENFARVRERFDAMGMHVGEMEVANGILVPALGDSFVRKAFTMTDFLYEVEEAYVQKSLERAHAPAKTRLAFGLGDVRSMPAKREGEQKPQDEAGVKCVVVFPKNRAEGLPSVIGFGATFSGKNGVPVLCADTHLTDMRTGAGGGIAVKYLANKGSRVVSFIGAGNQARTQLMAIVEIAKQTGMALSVVYVCDPNMEAEEEFANLARQYGLAVIGNPEARVAVKNADIVVLTTPRNAGEGEGIAYEWLKEGTTVLAIGADGEGKQEMAPDALEKIVQAGGRIVVDDIEQASHSGECHLPVRQGRVQENDLTEIGDIITQKQLVVGYTHDDELPPEPIYAMAKGRENEKQIVVYDATGIGVLDLFGNSRARRKFAEMTAQLLAGGMDEVLLRGAGAL